MHRYFSCLALLAISAGLATAATVTPYSDHSLFASAMTSPLKLTDFESGVTLTTFTGTDTWGVSYVDQNDTDIYDFYLANPANPLFNWTTGTSLALPVTPGASLRITFPTPVTGVGFNVMLITCTPCIHNSGPFQIVIDGVAQPLVTSSSSGPVFIGYTSDTPFNTIVISVPGAGRGLIDNLEFGNAVDIAGTDTVEVSTFLMIGSGLALLRFTTRKHTSLPTAMGGPTAG